MSFAFAVAVAYLVFERHDRQQRFGVVALPIIAAMLGVATFFPDEIVPLVPALQDSFLLTVHVSVIMTSYAVLTVAFAGAAVYLLQGCEVQRMTQWWVWAIAVLCVVVALAAVFTAALTDSGSRASVVGVLAGTTVPVALVSLLVILQQTTEVREKGLYVRFSPFVRRTIPWDEIVSAEARTYRPIREYGG